MTYNHRAAEHARHVQYFSEREYDLDDDGAYRWTASGNVIPNDIVRDWAEAGLITPEQRAHHEVARKVDTEAFMTRYLGAQLARTPEQIAEERAELLAAFGPGETVVNVLTGQRTQT